MERGKQYKTLEDAMPAGHTEIWYFKSDFARDAMMGYEWLNSRGRLPSAATLSQTHVKLGTVAECHALERIFYAMQGEMWSPNGEAWTMIKELDLHTSMSVGDIVKLPEGKLMMVDIFGFKEL
jgi:hypothetical protein